MVAPLGGLTLVCARPGSFKSVEGRQGLSGWVGATKEGKKGRRPDVDIWSIIPRVVRVQCAPNFVVLSDAARSCYSV